MANAALSYEEPAIQTVLVQSSFLLLLNAINWILDNAIYCGLLGQVFAGIAWGVPGANWLSLEVQDTIMQLGYLGLIFIVFEADTQPGGLSTSFTALWSNLYLSGLVALIGVSTPIALSFVLLKLLNATPMQAFASGAALCSTSLGTTFTILRTCGLDKSRLGVILSSAAMLDDVAGLVMTQIISNLGKSSNSLSATTVIRPVFVSVAFAVTLPLVCRLMVQPVTRYALKPGPKKIISTPQWAKTHAFAFVAQTLLLIGLVTSASYAGTSNLFAAYIAGTVTNWWYALVISIREENKDHEKKGETTVSAAQPHEEQPRMTTTFKVKKEPTKLSALAVYELFYGPAVKFILKPFFFASIGFSIPITQIFHGAILWRGLIYTLLMIFGKLICGLVLVRYTGMPQLDLSSKMLRNKGPKPADEATPPVRFTNGDFSGFTAQDNSASNSTSCQSPTQQYEQSAASKANMSRKRAASRIPKPQSLYPAAVLGSAMVARGEIGFLISSLAESTGVFGSGSSATSGSSEIFLIVTWAILLCTVIGPVSVGIMVKRVRRLQVQERAKETGKPDPLGIWGVM
ncbi:Sodium/hydrogen exchanger family-domain-containing protein [Delphinella strobiligena]|nr:Sodium/hydrogen exchanger family-domain-containing protein [Delphinella strobiligena]